MADFNLNAIFLWQGLPLAMLCRLCIKMSCCTNKKSRNGRRMNWTPDMQRWAVATPYVLRWTEGQLGENNFLYPWTLTNPKQSSFTKRFHSLCHFNREIAARGAQVCCSDSKTRPFGHQIPLLYIVYFVSLSFLLPPSRSTTFKRANVMI